MLALTPEQYRELSDFEDLGDAELNLPPWYDETTLRELVVIGLLAMSQDESGMHWRITERGRLALRVHRAALSTGVVA